MNKKDNAFIYISLALTGLILFVSYFGLFFSVTYAAEAAPWKAQCIGQDIVDLAIITPVMLISGILAYYGSRVSLLVFSGTMLYIAYTFAIYCFAVHYNFLFIAYCTILGLSFYSFIYFVASLISQPVNEWYDDRAPVRASGLFLLLCAGIFYFLWLSINVPAGIHNTIPADITQNGLFTNPVHVLDLSFFLPGLIITAILLLRETALGYLLAPIVLVFCLLMDITIAVLAVVMHAKGISGNLSVVWIMAVLASITSFLLYRFFVHFRTGRT